MVGIIGTIKVWEYCATFNSEVIREHNQVFPGMKKYVALQITFNLCLSGFVYFKPKKINKEILWIYTVYLQDD